MLSCCIKSSSSMVAANTDPNIPAGFPVEVYHNIADFLEPNDALKYAITCRTIKSALNLVVFHDTHDLLGDQQWNGPHGFCPSKMWFRFNPSTLVHTVHSIRFKCEFKDQGWGNRKGSLFIREHDTPGDEGEIVASSPVAEHDSTSCTLEFKPKPEKQYSMWYNVGSDGGHELYVFNPSLKFCIYDTNPNPNPNGTIRESIRVMMQNESLSTILPPPE